MLKRSLHRAIKFQEGEKIISTFRRPFISYLWQYFLAWFLILLAFFLIYPLLKLQWRGLLGFSIILVVGVFLLIRAFVCKYFTVLVLTNRRIIDMDQNGFFSRRATSVLLSKIKNVSWQKKGFWNSIKNTGKISIELYSDNEYMIKTKILLNGFYKPHQIASCILECQEKYSISKRKNTDTAMEMLKIIRKKLGRDEFARLLNE